MSSSPAISLLCSSSFKLLCSVRCWSQGEQVNATCSAWLDSKPNSSSAITQSTQPLQCKFIKTINYSVYINFLKAVNHVVDAMCFQQD